MTIDKSLMWVAMDFVLENYREPTIADVFDVMEKILQWSEHHNQHCHKDKISFTSTSMTVNEKYMRNSFVSTYKGGIMGL